MIAHVPGKGLQLRGLFLLDPKIHPLTSPINGRELHEQLGIESNYTTWFSRMCEYGFAEKADYEKRFPNLERG